MNELWNLVVFEYKKILRKRSIQITLLLAILISIISIPGTLYGSSYIEGKIYESYFDAMVKDRSYARELSGQELNSSLIMKAVEAYAAIPEAEKYQETKEYEKYARPYSGIYALTRNIFNTHSRRFNMEDFQTLTKEQAEQIYTLRHQRLIEIVNGTLMSEKAKKQVIAYDDKVKMPFTYSYTDGYGRFFTVIYTLGVTVAFAMAICIAPLFAGEYTTGADQLILSSRYGKNKLITAKLLTGFSFAAMISLFMTLLGYGLCMGIFGADGGDSPLQLYMILSPYPISLLQTALVLAVSTFFSFFMTAAITMLLSAKFKSPFGVIILAGILLVLPMLFSVPETNIHLYRLYHLLPANMMAFWAVMDGIQYEFLVFVIKPYVFLPIFAALISVILTPIAYRSFQRHQIV